MQFYQKTWIATGSLKSVFVLFCLFVCFFSIRLRLHGRGFQSKRFHDLETASKTTRFRRVYTEPVQPLNHRLKLWLCRKALHSVRGLPYLLREPAQLRWISIQHLISAWNAFLDQLNISWERKLFKSQSAVHWFSFGASISILVFLH